jgi:hypothetical protein
MIFILFKSERFFFFFCTTDIFYHLSWKFIQIWDRINFIVFIFFVTAFNRLGNLCLFCHWWVYFVDNIVNKRMSWCCLTLRDRLNTFLLLILLFEKIAQCWLFTNRILFFYLRLPTTDSIRLNNFILPSVNWQLQVLFFRGVWIFNRLSKLSSLIILLLS